MVYYVIYAFGVVIKASDGGRLLHLGMRKSRLSKFTGSIDRAFCAIFTPRAPWTCLLKVDSFDLLSSSIFIHYWAHISKF